MAEEEELVTEIWLEMAEEEEQLVTEIWQKKKNWLQKYGRRRRTGYRNMAEEEELVTEIWQKKN